MLNWNKLNIKQGQQLTSALKIEGIDREINICSIVFKKPIEYFEGLSLNELEKWIKKTGFLATYPEPKQIAPFRHGVNIYKFKTSAKQLSKQEFTLLQGYADKGVIENLHLIMALLSTRYNLIREKKQDHEIKAEIFLNHLPFGMAYSYALFFSAYYPILLETTQSYLRGVQEAASELTPS